MEVIYIAVIYLILINLVGFFSMGVDKKKAKSNQWRIKEKTLFFIAVIGGSAGSVLGMKVFRHKTKHTAFVIGMPLILMVQTILLIFLFSWFNKLEYLLEKQNIPLLKNCEYFIVCFP